MIALWITASGVMFGLAIVQRTALGAAVRRDIGRTGAAWLVLAGAALGQAVAWWLS